MKSEIQENDSHPEELSNKKVSNSKCVYWTLKKVSALLEFFFLHKTCGATVTSKKNICATIRTAR